MRALDRGVEDEAAGRSAARARLAAALRESVALCALGVVGDDELEAAAVAVERLNAELRDAMTGGRVAFGARSPMGGTVNAVAPPSRIWVAGDRVEARVTFSLVYEGPPGHVHGGYVASLFDEVLGQGQAMLGGGGMTANLTVRYRRPAPCNVELRAEAWIAAKDGRKQTVHGSLWHGEALLAEAEGLFIAPREWPKPAR